MSVSYHVLFLEIRPLALRTQQKLCSDTKLLFVLHGQLVNKASV